MKVAKSCRQCRTAKRKCTFDAGSRSACMICAQKGLECSLVRLNWTRPKPIAPAASASENCIKVNDESRDQLIDVYLERIHDKPHTLFHPATLKFRVQTGALPEPVLFSILALAARFSGDQGIRDRARDLFQTAKESFKRTLDEVTLDNIHAAALIGNICGVEGDTSGESLFFGRRAQFVNFLNLEKVLITEPGISFRMALILRLPEPSPGDDRIMKETRIRTYWSLYMIDQWSSAGLDMPRQIPDTSENPLPMPELEYWQLRPGDHRIGTTAKDHNPGLWGYMVILARIFGKIHELHRQLAKGDLTDVQTEEQTRVLALQLESFVQNLPPNVVYTEDNLEHHAMLGLGATFVALHLGYHHYSTLLYFHYLDSTVSRVPNQTLFAARCKYHAAAFSDLLNLSNGIDGCEAVYFIVSHMTVISSSVLLHTLLFGEPGELPDTRRRLSSNFQILLKLKQYWPDVNMMVSSRGIIGFPD